MIRILTLRHTHTDAHFLPWDQEQVGHDEKERSYLKNPIDQFIHTRIYKLKISLSAHTVSLNSLLIQTLTALLELCMACQSNSMAGCAERPCNNTAVKDIGKAFKQ